MTNFEIEFQQEESALELDVIPLADDVAAQPAAKSGTKASAAESPPSPPPRRNRRPNQRVPNPRTSMEEMKQSPSFYLTSSSMRINSPQSGRGND